MALRCTAKVLQFARVSRASLVSPEPDDYADWYVNLLWVGRRKCLLVTHAATAFSVMVLDVRAADAPALGGVVREAIRRALVDEGLAPDALGDLDRTTATVAATASRRVLAVMNDIAYQATRLVAEEGGAQRADPLVVARHLQRSLHTYAEGYDRPLDRARRAASGGDAPAAPSPTAGLLLRIDLEDMPQPVWRQLEIPVSATLTDLEQALLLLFGWEGYHLSAFFAGEPWRGPMYVSRAMLDEFEEAKVSDGVTVGELLGAPTGRLVWVYDFGDGWEHLITCEQQIELPERRMRCTAGQNAAPPDDCGGPAGYAELLVAIGDPAHPEHADLLEWLGRPFDPAAFDPDLLNLVLKELPGRRMRRRR
jgi:hypothetical protein